MFSLEPGWNEIQELHVPGSSSQGQMPHKPQSWPLPCLLLKLKNSFSQQPEADMATPSPQQQAELLGRELCQASEFYA